MKIISLLLILLSINLSFSLIPEMVQAARYNDCRLVFFPPSMEKIPLWRRALLKSVIVEPGEPVRLNRLIGKNVVIDSIVDSNVSGVVSRDMMNWDKMKSDMLSGIDGVRGKLINVRDNVAILESRDGLVFEYNLFRGEEGFSYLYTLVHQLP